MIAVAFGIGIAGGVTVALLLARANARRSQRDRVAMSERLALVRAMSQ